MTWEQWLKWASKQLNFTSSPEYESEIILGSVVNKSRAYLLSFNDTLLHDMQKKILNKLVYRRKLGEPIPYLLGIKKFWTLNLKISNDIFIPRSDTECLVEQVIKLFKKPHLKVLDLGTGSGAISLAIAVERPTWNITAVDNELKAIDIAQNNAYDLNINNVFFKYSNWFSAIGNIRYDIIISNPPYININDYYLFYYNMKFEPKTALVSQCNGLADILHICQNSVKYLLFGGWLMVEHSWKQGKNVRYLFKTSGFKNIKTVYDYGGNERITCGQWLYKF